MTTNTVPTASTIVMNALSQTSACAGGLIGWRGCGELPRAAIIAALSRAGLPDTYAPATRSNRAVLNDVLAAVHPRQIVKVLAPGLKKDKDGRRPYQVRWTLARKTEVVGLGDSVGTVAATIDLRDDDSTLYVDPGTDPEMIALCATVQSEYARLRQDVYRAATVSQWMAATLVSRFGGVRYSTGWFVPSDRLDGAAALAREMSETWGADWTDPPTIDGTAVGGLGYLPVTTSAGLARGVAASFCAEVAEVEAALDKEADAARAKGRDDVSAKVALRFLTALSELSDRAVAYRALCGDEFLEPTRQRLRAIHTRLQAIATDAAVRFSLLESDVSPEDEIDDRGLGLAARRADEALAARVASHVPATAPATAPVSAPVVAPFVMADDNASARFSRLELD